MILEISVYNSWFVDSGPRTRQNIMVDRKQKGGKWGPIKIFRGTFPITHFLQLETTS
jgi:hypothetical protein